MPQNGSGSVAATNGNGALQKLPSFFIVGPPRTGTTWLHTVLGECAWLSHPTKETRFFDKYYDRGLAWYTSHYKKANGGRVIGEVAPTYFASANARERIAQLIPGAKIVCTFRNPVERVLSLYQLKRAYGLISWTFDDALWRDPELMESGRYAAHLRDWISTFGPSQVLATVHDDMQADPQGYVDRIIDFVGATRLTLRPQLMRRVLTSESLTEPRNYYWTRGALRLAEWSKARRLDRFVSTAKRFGALRLFVGGGPKFPEIPRLQRETLRRLFRPEVEKLEVLMNRDLSAWK
jgi:hypothetical protein